MSTKDERESALIDQSERLAAANIKLLQQITAHREVEDELRKVHNYNRLLLECAGEGIYGIDPSGHCTFANQAACNMLGYTAEALQGRNMFQLVHHTDPQEADQWAITRTLSEGIGKVAKGEHIWRKDGSSFIAEYSAQPIIEAGQVQGAVIVFRDISEAHQLTEALTWQASHDPLTQLVNRQEFEKRLAETLRKTKVDNDFHALLYLDLDQFKIVNDTCGHAAGDELLKQLSEQFNQQLRSSDTLSRLGGDEFGIILHNCPIEMALDIAEKLRMSVEQYRLHWGGRQFSVGVSIGLVEIDSDSHSLQALLKSADAACYAAKDNGRNRVHLYHPDDQALNAKHGQMQWVQRIKDALDEDRFLLYFQPILGLQGEETERNHIELLVRMDNGHGKLLPPSAFLPAAERFNLMPQLDYWVVEHTLEWIITHHDLHRSIDTYSINLSGTSFNDNTFCDRLYHLLKTFGDRLSLHKLCFEVTETAAVADFEKAAQFIQRIGTLGCRFSLDDFGSGMSSFSYLRHLPVDYLKIDGSFVRKMLEDPTDMALVKSINEIGHVMGKGTVAEFVEDQATLDALRKLGVDFAQGYAIARPRAMDEIDRLVAPSLAVESTLS